MEEEFVSRARRVGTPREWTHRDHCMLFALCPLPPPRAGAGKGSLAKARYFLGLQAQRSLSPLFPPAARRDQPTTTRKCRGVSERQSKSIYKNEGPLG